MPAAVCLLDECRADLGDGYVRALGVRREFRGRGLAQLLLTRAFVYYRDRGRAGLQLGVDSHQPHRRRQALRQGRHALRPW